MPIMAIYRAREMDKEAFDRFRVEVPIEPIPDGAISHHVAFDGDGMIGIDVWETETHLDAFARDKLAPGLRRLGLALEPPHILDLHELTIAPKADRHNLTATTTQSA